MVGAITVSKFISQFLSLLGIESGGGIGPISVSLPAALVALFGVGPGGGIGMPAIVQFSPTNSGTYLFSLDYLQLITEAYERNGLSMESISAMDITSALRTINLIYAKWTSMGDLGINIDLQIQPLISGQSSFLLPPASNDILSMTINRKGQDLPMRRISRAEWAATVNKEQPGLPNIYYVERLSSFINVDIWMPSDSSTDYLSYYRSKQFQDAVRPSDATGLTVRWFEAACAELAARIALKKNTGAYQGLRADADLAFTRAMSSERDRSNIVIGR